jgi:2-oxoglutarate dehydrogenase E2 component (dihydrolipoamide succinyltransferase)
MHGQGVEILNMKLPPDVGDFVKQDEEVATIETDKVDVSVNSPASGTIIELFAAEEDNVAVGADLFKLELGDAPKEGWFA